jgi:hypothetical protein
MNFLNLLPALASSVGGMAGPEGSAGPMDASEGFPSMTGINNALARNAQLGQQQMQRPPGTPSKFMNALGMIGDLLSTWRGGQPLYQERLQQEQAKARQQQIGQQLANYLGADDPGLASIIAGDPGTGLELWKMKHPSQEPFTLGENQARFDASGREIAHGPAARKIREIDGVAFDENTGQPLFESPYSKVIPGTEGSFFEQPRIGFGRRSATPRVTDQKSYDAIQPGQQYMTPDGNIRVKPGGATASPSPTFR